MATAREAKMHYEAHLDTPADALVYALDFIPLDDIECRGKLVAALVALAGEQRTREMLNEAGEPELFSAVPSFSRASPLG